MTVKTSPDANGKILRDLEEDIVFGVFHPKERLTEEGLMARFGLKRHVVRNALSELDSIGLVVRVPNRGAYVRELTPHSEAIEHHDLRRIFRLNIQFHREQFLACGNNKLVQSILEYAQQAHLIRAIKYSEPGHLQKVEHDHRQIIKAMQGKNRDSLVEIVRNHLPESRDAYLRAYTLRHGSRFPATPA